MRKWSLPLTYEPKIQPVIDGTCRQTIRAGTSKQVGDFVRFYVWLGKPYHSKRKTITEYMPLIEVLNSKVYPWGFDIPDMHYGDAIVRRRTWSQLRYLAELDGIVPPTGEALRDVLMSKNKIPQEGLDCQILRW